AERRVSSGPTARGDAMTPTRRARGLFHEITEGVYWFLALDVLLLLAAAPTLLLWSVIGAGPPDAALVRAAADPPLAASAARPVHRPRLEDGARADPGASLRARLPPERAGQPPGRGAAAARARGARREHHPGRRRGDERPRAAVPRAGRPRAARARAGGLDRL